MAMTPAKRKAIRSKYEQEQKARKDVRLGIAKKSKTTKKSKRK